MRRLIVSLVTAATLSAGMAVAPIATLPAQASVWDSCWDALQKVKDWFYWVDTSASERDGAAVQPDGLVGYYDLAWVRDHGANIPANPDEVDQLRGAAGRLLMDPNTFAQLGGDDGLMSQADIDFTLDTRYAGGNLGCMPGSWPEW